MTCTAILIFNGIFLCQLELTKFNKLHGVTILWLIIYMNAKYQ